MPDLRYQWVLQYVMLWPQSLVVLNTAFYVEDLQISHHTGALSFASLDHIMVLRAVVKLIRNTHRAKTKTPMFHERLTMWNSGMTVRAQAMKFAIGTSGYVGSIIPIKVQGWNSSELRPGWSKEERNRISLRCRTFIYLRSSGNSHTPRRCFGIKIISTSL